MKKFFKYRSAANFASQHQSILSTIRRLPPEILEIIFIYVASSPSLSLSAERKERYYICDLPWNVSQVSLLWRRVALSTPTLWSQLPTVDLDQSLSAVPEYVEFLTELVERSRNGPLDVHIHARSLSNQRLPLLHLLLTQSPRWRRARLEVCFASLPIFESIKGRLSSLEELVLNIWSRSRTFGLVTVNPFEQAPKLRRVALSGYSEVRVLLPSGCLEEYWQGSIDGGQIHVALSSPSSMKILTAIHLPESRIPWSPTVIPYLTALRIRFQQFSDPASFLCNLTLPSVEEIQLASHTNILPSVLSLTARAGRSSALKKFHS
ncbi:hypothetical protein GALMADRAFT_753194 [Galerina marginata CBS 339.88]|uniref:Uncharacterized protein n=1 Tax=Galerina marginata (strain CBS 339.88) TaxID=685588 RepID=A0A067T0L1_GALM3|nr:hypothetical protein GALMADRAFT_753194 [Galerina marginata CBS 339.88]